MQSAEKSTEPTARTGIIGSGALGSYFGVRLACADRRVAFLLRSDFEAVSEGGFVLELSDGTKQRLENPEIYRGTAEMGRLDWVIIALKTTHNHLLPEMLRPLVGPGTRMVTLQNGLGNVAFLEEHFPETPVLGGLCQIGVNREAPGRIRSFVPGDGFVQLGAGRMATTPDLDGFHEMLEAAGIRVKRAPSLGEALWRKLMWNVPFNGLTVALGGVGTHRVCENEELREVARCLMEEIRTAANALGYPIEAGYTDKLLGFTDRLGDYKASSVLDWKAGRPLEVDAIFRKPLQAGQAAGVPMPHLATLCAILAGLRA